MDTPPKQPAPDQSRDQQDRNQQLRNLMVMAFADGSLGQREVDLVADRCVALDLSEADLNDAIQFGLNADASLDLPTEIHQRESLLADLIRMMAADGHLDENEKQLFALAAAKMQMTRTDVDRIIDSVLQSER